MKNRIIQETISNLQDEGLKFSVDTIAENLKISKKTIYKYFSSKEALALAVYEKFYSESMEKAQFLIDNNDDKLYSKLLYLYYKSKKMTRPDIFNKFQLNNVILSYTKHQSSLLWEKIASEFYMPAMSNGVSTLQVIIDGTFEKLITLHANPLPVIEQLEKLL